MTNTLLVTSTAEGTGKTAITLALARHASDRGASVGYMKPKGTRLQSNVGKTLDHDPMLARDLLGLDAEVHEMEPIVYSPTFIEGAVRGKEDPEALRERVRTEFDGLAADADRMFIEGGGVWTTGGVVDLTDADVADLLDARVLLVADYESPADLDAVLAAVDAFGDRIAGVVFNRVPDTAFDSLDSDAAPFLDARDVPVLGAVPRVRELAGVSVGDLAEEIGAEILTDTPTDAFIERFLVGAMGGDEALRHFRRARDAAVITGGDRADVQAAALDASGVRCLILTGGHSPSGAVLGKAAEAGKPVLSVNTDTGTTIDRVEAVVQGGRTRDARTVELMVDLLADNADLDGILR